MKLMYIFGPPGWSHDGSRKTSKQLALDEKNISAKMVLNFVGNESVYDIHKDIQYVISFQCIGNIEYRIFVKDKKILGIS